MVTFLFLGNLIEEKGVLVLLDACSLLKQNNADFICHVVGGESRDLSLESVRSRIQTLQLEDKVLLHGPLYGEKKEAMLQAADVMVFPTFYHNECFPLVILEGMKNKLAIISTNEGAIADMIQHDHTGFIIEKNNPLHLARAMDIFAQQPQLAQDMGQKAYAHFCAHFTESLFIESMAQILRES